MEFEVSFTPAHFPIALQCLKSKDQKSIDISNKIKGSRLDDVIIGGYRNDVLKGAEGDDYIVSFGDKDKVRGGNGEDTFVLSVGDGFTVIRDYDPLEDTIVLPSDDYTLVEGLNKTKLYIGDDFVARINGYHTTIVWVHWYIKNKLGVGLTLLTELRKEIYV